MKVLHVNDYYHPQGGVEQYLLSVADLLEQSGCENAILYRKAHPHTIRDGRWPAHLLDRTVQPVGSAVQAVVHAERPDIAYVHHTSSPRVIEAFSELVPTVAYIHGFAAVCPGLAKYFRRGDEVCQRPFGWGCVPMHYLRRCSAARHPGTLYRLMLRTAQLRRAYLALPHICVATGYMKGLMVQNGFDPDRISLLPPHFFPDDAPLDFRAPGTPPSLLFAGRLEVEKGLPYLLRAVSRLCPRRTLVVAGDGSLRPRYEALARDLGLSDAVRFTGWLDQADLRHAFQSASVVVMPSLFPEPFGKTGVEALAQGRPVVAFDVGGISDWLRDGVDGFLVSPTDVDELTTTIQRVLTDRSLLLEMGRCAQDSVFRRFSAGDHLRQLLTVLGVTKRNSQFS